jgi:ZIP family zinc transporter
MREIFFALLFLAGGTWFAGIFGAAGVAFFRRKSIFITDLLPGFTAGIILMVSFLELLHPSMHLAEETSLLPAWIVIPCAFATGFFLAFYLSSRIKKTKRCKCKRGVMLISALSAHSLPEGLALGVLLGSLGRGYELSELWVLVPVFLAVAMHKFPEGAAVSALFREDGFTKKRCFVFGQASGFFAFLSGAVGFLIAANVNFFLPFAMAFAGGAMIWVAIHELIPRVKNNFSAIGLFLGIFLMLFVDITLHIHHNGNDCTCACIERDEIIFRTRQGVVLE